MTRLGRLGAWTVLIPGWMMLGALSLFAGDAAQEDRQLEVQKEELQGRVESIQGKISEIKSDKATYRYVLELVNRARETIANPALKYSDYVREIDWTEKQIADSRRQLEESRQRAQGVRSRVQFIDRDLALRELIQSLNMKETEEIQKSIAARTRFRDENLAELKELENDAKLRQLKLDLILEYRKILERNRIPRLNACLLRRGQAFDAVLYVVTRGVTTGLLFMLIAWAGRRLFAWRSQTAEVSEEPRAPQGFKPHFINLLKVVCALFMGYGILAALLVIWDLGLSRLDLIGAWMGEASFSIGAFQISLMRLVEASVAVGICWTAGQFLNSALVKNVYPRFEIEESLQYSYSAILRYGSIVVGSVMGMHILGIPLASLSLFTGALGIGVGFGLQELFKNFIAGLNILMERSVKVGDLIQVGDLPGKVREINAQNTVVDTFDNISVLVPNLEFTNQRIINWSHSDRIIRISLSVAVAYGSDTQLAKKALMEVAASHPKVLKNRTPSVVFEGFGESALNFKLFAWINEPENRAVILSDLYFYVDQKFRDCKIEIPFPQRDVHVKSYTNTPLNK